MSKKRIYWDDFDKNSLIKCGVEVRRRHPTFSMMQVFKKAQEIAISQKMLDHDKKRNITTMSMVPWFEEAVADQIVSETPDTPEVIKVEKPIGDYPTDALASELLRRFMKPIVKEVVTSCLADMITAQNYVSTATKAKPSTKRAKIAIVGLLDGQENLIEGKFPNIDFKFAKSKDSNLYNICRHADYVILMTKFISHSAQSTVMSLDPILYEGGMSGLAELIRRKTEEQ